ncbi:MAG: ATP-binding cassette domain-containing protein [Coxiellaceae bacterium]|nr:ATP-binding cassette domain-containing protein [Coxiellaceae bacterium]
MKNQLRAQKICLQWGEHPLFDQLNFQVNNRDRVAIIGRNGAGKSTLLKMIQGDVSADSGQIEQQSGLTIATLAQTVPQDLTGTVHEFVSAAHQAEYDWQSHEVDRALSQLNLTPEWQMNDLSGGQVRRALLAAALVNDPDILLLDEPTNHLDIESIEWLEKFLINSHKTIIFITHDRAFMQRVATRIFELDIGQITCWDKDYTSFIQHKQQQLAAEAEAQHQFDKKLAQEEVWIRQGIKARRTRNEGRVRDLKKMREHRQQRRSRQGNLSLAQQKAEYAGKLVLKAENVGVKYNNEPLIDDFSTLILRGDKIGIVGPNGCGKSTLLNLLLTNNQPDIGSIERGTQLQVAYFDQHRAQLDPSLTVIDNVSGGRDKITINGKEKHIISYLQDFLFTPQTSRSLVKTLSGGEQNRVLLAKILSQPANMLVLDEPTNDLDMETLELLEEFLLNYQGTLLIVSHDRSLLNQVVTSTLVFEDNKINEYIGGYDDYLRQSKAATKTNNKTNKQTNTEPKSDTAPKKRKLSYKEQREQDQLMVTIEQLENKINELQKQLADPDLYQQDADKAQSLQKQLTDSEKQLKESYQKWENLDNT